LGAEVRKGGREGRVAGTGGGGGYGDGGQVYKVLLEIKCEVYG